MPRQPDPELEERILNAAHALWKRGGEQALTMRAVARVARTNTPAVYRRFKNRLDLIRGLLRRIGAEIGEHFSARGSIEGVAEAYVEFALARPHDYELFYGYSYALAPQDAAKNSAKKRAIRESRQNFALVEDLLAKRLGGVASDHTQLALSIWAMLHGTCMLLLEDVLPPGHEQELRRACREAIKALLDQAESAKGG